MAHRSYDPKRDGCLRCECGTAAEYDDWSDVFHGLAQEQIDIGARDAEHYHCPRVVVRHAVARLAVAVALLSDENDTRSRLAPEHLLNEVPGMLREMIDDAMMEVQSAREEHTRGRAAGWRSVN